jgi:CRP-like cAMP-binding protein
MENIIKNFQIFTERESNYLSKHLIKRVLEKGDFVVQSGEICEHLVFVESGLLRSLWSSHMGEDITRGFTFSGQMTTAYTSFITGQVTEENIQALVRSELILLPKNVADTLSASSINWLIFLKNFLEKHLLQQERRMLQFQKGTAHQRYQHLQEHFPDYLQQIPLQYLATFLGITQRHLSRLRNIKY